MIAPCDCAALILAAGQSRRFGPRDKLLEPLEGRPLIDHICKTVGAFGFGRSVAVVANRQVEDIVAGRQIEVISISPGGAQGASLRHGGAALADSSMVMVFLGDMPFISARHITNMLNAAEPGKALASRSRDYFGPPALLPLAHLAVSHETDSGARSMIRGGASIKVDRHSVCDFDHAEDFL